MDSKALEINFIIPDQTLDYKTKVSNYYSHLIGHESKGPLFYFFKKLGWVAHLSAGPGHTSGGGSDLFSISLDLTDEDLKNYENILVNVFEFGNA
ncbi:hypothetical protein NADFUDRAFT_68215 [Nadsonia fulvescens var. elongata DSM 6958]|uniref:Peptidase M16 C-terminal domain-containing protein n=1 Tax=Nadsonia fulvescens var. elongata DSM 6958 TaxID=857566 RepID=A0A1E3PQX8_9ASCO|nr:hypothetical protein NADFUDRAFT_68215 [Nadsonia fulvescens var. elongata DSM 6958]